MAELKMLRFSLGVTRMDKIKNEYIRGSAHVEQLGQKLRGKTEMVWACAEKGSWLHWEKNVGDGAARKEEEGKTKEEVHGCGERGYAGSGRDGGRCGGPRQMEANDSLWRPLTGKAERQRRSGQKTSSILFPLISVLVVLKEYWLT